MRIINIDTPTWPLPTNTNVPKHTQNSYGMCYLHTTGCIDVYNSHIRTSGYLIIHWGEDSRNPVDFT
jgi:hypothetical protein